MMESTFSAQLILNPSRRVILRDSAIGFEGSYNVDDSCRITDPGQFETEPCFIPYFWELVLHGMGAFEEIEEGLEADVLDIPVDVKRIYPRVLKKYSSIALWRDDLGFVNHRLLED